VSEIEQQRKAEREDYGAVTIKIVGLSMPSGRKRVTVNITDMLAGVAQLRADLQKLEAAIELPALAYSIHVETQCGFFDGSTRRNLREVELQEG